MSHNIIQMFLSMFSKKYTKQDLATLPLINNKNNWRNHLPIAIIDDEGLSDNKIRGLRSRGFIIDTLTDVENIRTVAEYPIIISDVVGVGHKIDENEEGLALISELAKVYPFKALAIYSGAVHKLPSLPEGVTVINKDDELERWTEKIDKMIDRIANPISVWNNLAKRMIDGGVPTDEISKIESDFVNRILHNKSFADFPKTRGHISPMAEAVISGIISNGAFFAMTKVFGL